MFNTIRQYLSSRNNSDSYSRENEIWQKNKNHHFGNWLSDTTGPFANSMSLHENEKRSFWNKLNKKNKYHDFHYENQHAMSYGNDNKRLHNVSSHKSLLSMFRVHQNDYPQYYHSKRLSHPNGDQKNSSLLMMNGHTVSLRQRHHSLPSSMNPNGQNGFMTGRIPLSGNGMNALGYPMMHQYPYHLYDQKRRGIYVEPSAMNYQQSYNHNYGNDHALKERRHSVTNTNQYQYMDPNYYYYYKKPQQYGYDTSNNYFYQESNYDRTGGSLKMFR